MHSKHLFINAFTVVSLLLLSSCLVTVSTHQSGSGNIDNTTIKGPVFTPSEGQVETNTPVTISTDMEGVSIYYTMGSGEPNILYTEPIVINRTTVIRAITFKDKNTFSEEVSARYTVLRVASPVMSPLGGEVLIGSQITITTATSGADIYYTTDGTDPTISSSLYTVPITINDSTTVKAIAVKRGYIDSYIASSIYTMPGSVIAPTFDPPSGEVAVGSTVRLVSATEGASIYYTTDGSTPNQSARLYTALITIEEAVTINAKAYKTGYPPSAVSSATYIISQVEDPEFDPSSSTVNAGTQITISTPSEGADIFYTDDSSDPTCDGENTKYVGPITLNTVGVSIYKAIACKDNWNDSSVSTATYIVTLSGALNAPQMNPETGTISSSSITITMSADVGATIYYTTDGSVPICGNTEYSGPITLTGTGTYIYKAISCKTNYSPSGVRTSTYVITGTVSTPVLSPGSGTYTSSQSLTMRSDTAGAEIHYTGDGSLPTCSTGDIYSSAITVASPGATYKAVACKNNWAPSLVTTVIYDITGIVADPVLDPLPGTYTSSKSVSMTSNTTGAVIRYTSDGSTPTCSTGNVYTSPITVSNPGATYNVVACKAGWIQSSVITGVYTITGTLATPMMDPVSGSYEAPQNVTLSSIDPGVTMFYTVDGSTPICGGSKGIGFGYMSPIVLDVPNLYIVKAIACKADWIPSTVSTTLYDITGKLNTPYFITQPDAYEPPQDIEIGAGDHDASIYYTTDGSTPVCGDSLYYDGPITLSLPGEYTFNAIECRDNWTTSDVVSATYTMVGMSFVNKTVDDGLIDNNITSLFVDDGNIYAGTSSGLSISTDGGESFNSVLDGTRVTSLFVYSGTLYVGTDRGLFISGDNGSTFNIFTTEEGLPSDNILSLFVGNLTVGPVKEEGPGKGTDIEKAERALFVGTDAGLSISIDGGVTFTTFNEDNGIGDYGNSAVNSLFVKDAVIYAGTQNGLSVSTDKGETFQTYTTSNGLDFSDVKDVFVYNGKIFVTTDLSVSISGDGGSTFVLFNRRDGIGNYRAENMKSLYLEEETLYVGTEAGLSYSLNGVTPFSTYTAEQNGLISNNINKIFVKDGTIYAGTDSGLSISELFTLGVVDAPVLSPGEGTYVEAPEVTIASGTPDAVIHYTLDGTTPTCSSQIYSSPVKAGKDEPGTIAVLAIACKKNWTSSAVAGVSYTVTGTLSDPVFTPVAGSYQVGQSITISPVETHTRVYYTINSGTAACGEGTLYTSPIYFNTPGDYAVRAISCKDGWISSNVVVSTYTISGAVAPPEFSLGGGTYTSTIEVSMSDATSGATIRYTLDGSNPTCSTGTMYQSAPVIIANPGAILKAIACKNGWTDSSVMKQDYTVTGTVAAPTFSPGTGAYIGAQLVTISSATSGVTIRYSTSLGTPTCSSGTIYTTGVSVTRDTTLKAIACKTDWATSAVSTATYTIR